MRNLIALLLSAVIISPAVGYSATDNLTNKRDRVMSETLALMETGNGPPPNSETNSQTEESVQSYDNKKHNLFSNWEENKQKFHLGDAYVTIGAKIGYIQGDTTYDFNHHTSELEFPMNNWMAGGGIGVGFKDLSVNSEVWGQIEKYAGYDMKDRDWDTSGDLISYTKSKADMDALIWDVNLRYDFYKNNCPWENDLLVLSSSDKIKIGALLGYRYERFGYQMSELKYPDIYDIVIYPGQKVATYKIKYSLPYVGLVTEITNPKYGFSFNIKYSFKATAKDQDNHVLRYLTFYGDYDKHGYAFMGGLSGFLNINKSLKISLGIDGEIIRIKGTTWEESHDPAWDADQDTDAKYMIFWSGVEYKF